jgi:hypothetical protein
MNSVKHACLRQLIAAAAGPVDDTLPPSGHGRRRQLAGGGAGGTGHASARPDERDRRWYVPD